MNIRCLQVFSALGLSLFGIVPRAQPSSRTESGVSPVPSVRIWKHSPDVSIPFKLIHGIPVIELQLNGAKNQTFLIDSGAEKTVVDRGVASNLNVKLSSNVGVMLGTGDSAGQPMAIATSLHISYGRDLLLKGSAFATDLTKFSEYVGTPLSGIIGYDLLRAHLSIVDFTTSHFDLFSRNALNEDALASAISLHVNRSDLVPVFMGFIAVDQGTPESAKILLDTGSDRAALLLRDFAEKSGIAALQGWKRGAGAGMGGKSLILDGLEGRLDLGSEHVDLSEVSINMAKDGLARTGPYDVMIGSPVLSRWCMIFDIAHERILLVYRLD